MISFNKVQNQEKNEFICVRGQNICYLWVGLMSGKRHKRSNILFFSLVAEHIGEIIL